MNLHLPTVQLALEARAPLSIHEGRATRVTVLEGTVWITEEGRVEDFFVSAGQQIELQGSGRAVLLADHAARIEVRHSEPVTVRTGNAWFDRVRGLVARPRQTTATTQPSLTVF